MIEAACLMLDHLNQNSLASRIRNAISKVVAEGKVRTYDMMMLKGSPDVISKGAASTVGMTDAIIDHLK
jgi:3-isopropylmalate dehydrogenase